MADDYLKHMHPSVRARNAHLEPTPAEKSKRVKGRLEGELQDQIVARLQELGYKVAFFRPARVVRGGVEIYETPVGGDGVGWPDIVALKDGRAIVLELKSETGTVKDEQIEWLRVWAQVPGATVMVIRTDSWRDLEPLL